ncbi:hypothetical protein SAMN03159463_05522 [Mesorhizobium sp. NFR06]|uniref:hypothetical protein n=1 Tax=Mesorhizobium sp. NFR06 TaxID=1566290 RepID=UPI0008E22279|nr:hypothetical protein [Mesorhizobium sp. NFR06]SFQ06607.1 hypothetical protein SAMN03159463_05522 [Mesorhizobium sp. NFR06]
MAKKKSKLTLSTIEAAARVAASEAAYFARRCGLTPDEALRIMREAHETLDPKARGNGERKR